MQTVNSSECIGELNWNNKHCFTKLNLTPKGQVIERIQGYNIVQVNN